MSSLLAHAHVLTLDDADTELEDGWILFDEGFVTAVGAGVILGGVVLVRSEPVRVVAVALLFALGGLAWGAARLDVLDRSVLLPLVGTTERVVVVVTAPARRTPFAVRVFARTELVGNRRVSEAVLLSLPPGRAPPQGARLELLVDIEAPRPPDDGRGGRCRSSIRAHYARHHDRRNSRLGRRRIRSSRTQR